MATFKTFEKRQIALEQAVQFAQTAKINSHAVISVAEDFLNFLAPEAPKANSTLDDGDAS